MIAFTTVRICLSGGKPGRRDRDRCVGWCSAPRRAEARGQHGGNRHHLGGGPQDRHFDYRYVPRAGPMSRFTGPLIDKMLTATFTGMVAATDKAAHSKG